MAAANKPDTTELIDTGALRPAERLRLMHQSLFNILGPVLSGLVGVILVPVMLRGLGAEPYGLWVMVVTIVGSCAAVADFGVSWSVIREVAAFAGDADSGPTTERFVCAAANFYLLLAIAEAAAIAALGLPVGRFMLASSHHVQNLPEVFMLAAAVFFAGQMLNFQIVVLQGLRRFDLSNLLSLASTLLGGIAIIVLIEFGRGLLSVMQAQAASSALCALAGYKLVTSIQPRFRQRLGGFDWALLRSRMAFSLGVQLSSMFSAVTWEGAPLLIGFMLGPASVASYHIGRKFPAAVVALLWPVGVVMFPAASEHQHAEDLKPAAAVLEAGSRWLMLLAIPICIVMWITAPDLLRAWLGRIPDDALPILRLMTVAVLVYAISVTAFGVLMGRAAIEDLLAITGSQAAVVTALSVVLLTRIGVRGAAWGLLAPVPLVSAALLSRAARSCGVALRDLLRRVAAGHAIPAAACATAAFLTLRACEPGRWLGVLLTAIAGAIAYYVSFYFKGAREEERIFLRQWLAVSRTAAAQCRVALRALRRLDS